MQEVCFRQMKVIISIIIEIDCNIIAKCLYPTMRAIASIIEINCNIADVVFCHTGRFSFSVDTILPASVPAL